MTYTKKAVRGVSAVFIFTMLAAVFGYLVRMLLTRRLSVEDYGLFYTIMAFIALAGVLKDLGLGQALVKLLPQFIIRKQFNLIKGAIVSVFSLQLVISVIVAVVLTILADYLSVNYFATDGVDPAAAAVVLIMLAFSYALRPINFMYRYIFQGFQRMYYFASVDLVRMVIIFLLCLIGFVFSTSVIVPAIAYLIAPAILFIIFTPIFLFKVFPSFFRVKMKFDKYLAKEVFKYGIPLMLATAGWIILGNTDTLMIKYFFDNTQAGYYNVALPTANILAYVSIALIAVVLPLTSELWERKKKIKIVQGLDLVYRYSFVAVLPLIFTMISFPKLIIAIIFEPQYAPAAQALQVLAVGIMFLTVAKINFAVLSAIGKPSVSTKIVIVAAVFNLLVNIILIPIYGILGAAITTLAGLILMMVLSLIYLGKSIPIKVPIWGWMKTVLAALVFLALVTVLKKYIVLAPLLEIISVALIAGVIYIALLFLLRIVSIEEIKGLIRASR